MDSNVQQSAHQGTLGVQGGQQTVSQVISVKEWMLTMLIMIIPIVNIIMMFVWAFSSGENPSKANYFKASLIWAAIVLALYIIFFIISAIFLGSLFSSLDSY